MKKSFIIISLILVIILSSFSFAFAADSSDYSWLIGKPIIFNSELTPFPYHGDNTYYSLGFFDSFGHTYTNFGMMLNEYLYIWEPDTFTALYRFDTGYFPGTSPFSITISSFFDLEPSSLSSDEFFSWLFANSNADSFRPVKSVTSELIQPVVNLLSSVRSGISTFFTFVTNAFNDIYSIPAVFPSLWALVPSSVTSVYLGMFVIVTFMGILKFILSK